MKFLILLLCIFGVNCEDCRKASRHPANCFDIEEVLDYVEVAKKLEKSNRELWDLLTEGGFVVDETEVKLELECLRRILS